MKNREVRTKQVDWEKLGRQTMLESNTEPEAIEICGLHLQSYADKFQPEMSELNSDLEHQRTRAQSLYEYLYDRAVPVNDASMLTHSWNTGILLALSCAVAATCITSNLVMCLRMAWGILWSSVAAPALMLLLLALGYLFYEKIVAQHEWVQGAIIVLMAALGIAAFFQFALARQAMTDKVEEQSATRSYVDDSLTDDLTQPSSPTENTETKVRGTFGRAWLLASAAGEFALGFLVGMYVEKRTDQDYAAWCKLGQIHEAIAKRETRIAEIRACIEITKKQCLAGIRHARSIKNQRKTPYHKALALVMFTMLLSVAHLHSQTLEHYDGILIDTSSSITRGGTNSEPFQRYLRDTKRLLATEPPNTRVWVSSIATNSFGGGREMVRGWTPDAQGIFTADLSRARRQLVVSFEANSASLSAKAQGTDIFGGLWHMKTSFDSANLPHDTAQPSRTIWIFSDMMNETPGFDMPRLLEIGPERMLERAKAQGLVVPLRGYEIHVQGASPSGLTPQQWLTIRRFWERYFSAAGANIETYSPDCGAMR